MSNHLAVATVTRTLTQTLGAVVAADVPGATATALRPDGPAGAGGPAPRVNLFLYQATPNAQLRNEDLPTRNGNGALSRRPVAALDLHYLLTFYGNELNLEPQRVFGSVVRHLHANPLLRRDDIEAAIGGAAALAGSDLASQPEAVRLSPIALSLEDLSKLWSVFFQVPYALSAAYMASLVLLEADGAPASAYPVRHVRPAASPASPARIERISPERATFAAGLRITLTGEHLDGPGKRVRFGEADATLVAAESSAQRAVVEVPAGVRPGIIPVQVVDEGGLGPGHVTSVSNVALLALAPAVQAIAFQSNGNAPRFELTVAPAVGALQRAELVATQAGARQSTVLAARPRTGGGTSLVFPAPGLPPGQYIYRLRVDGAETELTFDTTLPDPLKQPVNGPTVTVP